MITVCWGFLLISNGSFDSPLKVKNCLALLSGEELSVSSVKCEISWEMLSRASSMYLLSDDVTKYRRCCFEKTFCIRDLRPLSRCLSKASSSSSVQGRDNHRRQTDISITHIFGFTILNGRVYYSLTSQKKILSKIFDSHLPSDLHHFVVFLAQKVKPKYIFNLIKMSDFRTLWWQMRHLMIFTFFELENWFWNKTPRSSQLTKIDKWSIFCHLVRLRFHFVSRVL